MWRARLYAAFETLNIVAEFERHGGTRLKPVSRYNPREYYGPCPWYLNCPSGQRPCDADEDGFIVWPTLNREINGDAQPRHFWCRKCGRSGDIAKFLELYYGVKTSQACAMLEINPNDPNQQLAQRDRKYERSGPTKDQLRIVEVLESIYPRAQQWLQHPRALAYLDERSVSLETAQSMGVGYIPAMSEGVEIEEGCDQWCDKIIFPAQSQTKVQGFRGRTLAHWQPGMDENEHRQLLKSLDVAPWLATYEDGYFNLQALSSRCPVLVEGPFDVLACLSSGIQALPIGTSKFPSLSRVRQAILALDNDDSGREASKRIANSLGKLGIGYRVCSPTTGKDWSEAYRVQGVQGLAPLQETLQTLQFCEDCDLSTFSSQKPFQEHDGHVYCALCYPMAIKPAPKPIVIAIVEQEPVIPVSFPPYEPVLLPGLPRFQCPCVTLGWNAKGEQTRQLCREKVTDNGFCEEHQLAYRVLELGSQLGYPEMHIPYKSKWGTSHRTLYAGVQCWEERASTWHVDRPQAMSENVAYLEKVTR
jgi:hypothetical protein